jgi:hypothetical protein
MEDLQTQISAVYSLTLNLAGEVNATQALCLALIETRPDREALTSKFEAHVERVKTLYLYSEAHEQLLVTLEEAAGAIRKALKG